MKDRGLNLIDVSSVRGFNRIPSKEPCMSDLTLSDSESEIREARKRDSTIVLAVNCEVQYDGRANSDLGGGDRLLVLKPDGTVLVHGPEKSKPRNWMTGASYTFGLEGDELAIHAEQSSSEGVEELDIWVADVYDIITERLLDDREKSLAGTEADLKSRLVDNPELIEEGFRVESTEWETGAGPVDIFGYDSDGNAVLAELKRRQIDPEAVHQLRRYLEVGFEDDFVESEVRGIVVAPSISEQAMDLVEEYGFVFVEEDPRRKVSSETTSLSEF